MPIASWNGELPEDALLDSGVLYLASAVFSAQDGGLKFDPGIERRQITFDGQRAPVMALDRTTAFMAKISGNFKQIPVASFPILEPGATTLAVPLAGGPVGATQIQPQHGGTNYAAGDYVTDVRAVWERTDGSFFQIRFPKALCTKWDLTGKDKEEGLFAIEFEARLDMSVTGALVTAPPYVVEYFPGPPA